MSEPEDDFEIVIQRIPCMDFWCDPMTGKPAEPVMMTREEFAKRYPRSPKCPTES